MTISSRFAAAGRALFTKSGGGLSSWLNVFGGEDGTDLHDPYNVSPWVSSAINHIARPICQVPLEFFDVAADGSEVPRLDRDLSLFWKRPAKGLSAGSRVSLYDSMEATVGWLLLKGSFAWILDDTWLVRGARNKSPFAIVNPDRLTPIKEDGELIGWRLRDDMGRMQTLLPEQVAGSRFWNPTDAFKGSAPMTAASMAATSDYAAAKFWKHLAESNGDLGETIVAPSGITDDQRQQIITAIREKRKAAKAGKFLPRFFIGDVKTEEPKIKSPDAAAVTQRLQNRHEVYIAFGVPPSFAEVTASYSVGSASDRYKLIEEACRPISTKVAQAVEAVCMLLDGREVTARFNFDDHSTMQEVRTERLSSGVKLHERGMPWDVVSDVLKLRLPAFAGSDKAWLPFNLHEVTVAAPVTPVVVPPQLTPAAKALDELEVLLRGCPAHDQRTTRDDLAEAAQRTPDAKRAAKAKRWEMAMKVRAPHVKRIRTTVDAALYKARVEVLGNIARAKDEEKAIRNGAFDFIFDLGKFLELLIEPIFRMDHAAYEAAGAAMVEEIGAADPFIPADPLGLEWLQARKNHIKDAGTEVWTEIRDSLDQGLQDGETFDELAARVREEFNGISKEKSMTIAITETGVAFESGRHEAMVQCGVEWKEWLDSGDDKVRDTHRMLNGRVIPIDEAFIVGGFPMQYPCDPTGPAKEVIRCRCIHGPAEEPETPDIIGNDPSFGIPF